MNSTKWLTCIAIITIAIGALQTILSSHSVVNINKDNNGGEIRNEESVEVARSSYHRLAVQFPPQTIRSSLTIPSEDLIRKSSYEGGGGYSPPVSYLENTNDLKKYETLIQTILFGVGLYLFIGTVQNMIYILTNRIQTNCCTGTSDEDNSGREMGKDSTIIVATRMRPALRFPFSFIVNSIQRFRKINNKKTAKLLPEIKKVKKKVYYHSR